MSLLTITWGFEGLHTRLTRSLDLSTTNGDLLLAVAFAILCGFLQRVCNRLNAPLCSDEIGKIEKFREVVYKLIVRIWLSWYSITLCLSKDYFWDTTLYFEHADGSIRGNHCTREIMVDERIYYVTLFGYYLNHTITQFVYPKRQDFWVLCAHHIITLLLIGLSYKSGFTSVGVVLGMCHEPADLLLTVLKLLRYLGMKVATNIVFVIFALTWIYSRLYLYPLKCIVSLFGPWRLFFHDYFPVPLQAPPNCVYYPVIEFIVCLMLILYLLHVYWTILLVKAIMRKFGTGSLDDVRSGKEDGPAGGLKED